MSSLLLIERMLQAYTLVHLTYTEIESAASVEEELTLENQLEKDTCTCMLELKKARAALMKAMNEKNKILEAEEIEEVMTCVLNPLLSSAILN